MVWLFVLIAGPVLLYFWLRGHWFAAVVAMVMIWAYPGLLLAEALDKTAPILNLFAAAALGLAAWIPYAIHRANRRQPAAPVIAPQPIHGITLASRDAPFNG